MYNYFVLGAGFSAAGGLPVGAELFKLIVLDAKRDVYYTNILKPEIERYQLYLERTAGLSVSESQIDFEQFMSFLDIEHFLRLAGSETWSAEGSRAQNLVRHSIARILWLRQRRMSPADCQLYDYFVSKLTTKDVVVTFNYDTVLEDALDRIKLPYRLVPYRYEYVAKDGSGTLADRDELVLFKLHGSIDWFDEARYRDDKRYRHALGLGKKPRHPVFNNPGVRRRRIVSMPYPKSSQLRRIHRVRNLEAFFEAAMPVIDTPLLISPSQAKLVYLNPLLDLWFGMDSGGSLNTTLAIIGYSLPPYDDYVRRALYQVIRNFQHYDTGGLVNKTNIKLVDRRLTEGERENYRRAYSFVDWSRADTYFDGFNEAAVDMLFAA